MKIILFIFSFTSYFVINALFFSDETMHIIFEGKGIFSLIVFIPKIMYSTIISVTINKIMKLLALSEKDIIKMREEKKIDKVIELSKKIVSSLKVRLNIFCIICFLIMFLFWYYISCFCATYINTQIILIEDTIFSFAITLFYPFLLYLLPGLFRIPSLKNNKKIELYTISKIIAFI